MRALSFYPSPVSPTFGVLLCANRSSAQAFILPLWQIKMPLRERLKVKTLMLLLVENSEFFSFQTPEKENSSMSSSFSDLFQQYCLKHISGRALRKKVSRRHDCEDLYIIFRRKIILALRFGRHFPSCKGNFSLIFTLHFSRLGKFSARFKFRFRYDSLN
jgi:hypothetical protein